MSILLITPPFVQLNSFYPATTQLTGFLRYHGHECTQYDLGIDTALGIFSKQFILKYLGESHFANNIEAVIKFLQGQDPTLATRIVAREFLPEGKRFCVYDDEQLDWAFGSTGVQDKAKHLATLYIQDLADLIREKIAPEFDIIRYAEQIAIAATTFDPVIESANQVNPVTKLMLDLLDAKISQTAPQFIGFSVPFPGCLVTTLQCAQYIKKKYPHIQIIMGGGYVNTELRTLTDERIFDYIDYLCFDDGELPLLRIIEGGELVRTMVRGKMSFVECHEKFQPIVDFDGIESRKYISFLELVNPMHKMWSDGFWNKLTMAHGCYWAKCAFCDTRLDYIGRYDAQSARNVVDTMEKVMAQTGSSGFHFTDEALPPKLLCEVAEEILRRKIVVSYWGNIRFEKAYTPERCKLLAKSGFVAASGGLEVASPRILKKINKGVTIDQAEQAALNLTEAGIMIHAYLMYGFPTQTFSETVESLDVVRSMFANGALQSAFWHCFALTAHSPIGAEYNVKTDNPFANNGVDFDPQFNYDLEAVGAVLKRATYNFMHGLGLETPAKKWFKGII